MYREFYIKSYMRHCYEVEKKLQVLFTYENMPDIIRTRAERVDNKNLRFVTTFVNEVHIESEHEDPNYEEIPF